MEALTMARKNIFELLDEKWNREEELVRVIRLFQKEYIISDSRRGYTLKDFVNAYCFKDWKNRGRYIDMEDYLQALNFDALYKRAAEDIGDFLTTIEIIYNFYQMALVKTNGHRFNHYTGLATLRENMDICLAQYNYSAFYFEEKEQVTVSEKDPAVTAATEISDSETAFQIIQYNHHLLKGDIKAKKKILLHLASELEPKRSMLNRINKVFSDDIFMLLNNLNLRHNNCDSKSKDYKKHVANMPKEKLEEWYDELYQMILLAKLELDHLARKDRIIELKTHFHNNRQILT